MKPNLVIIGGQKCGTTSLHYYLKCHPEIFMSEIKELKFFVESETWTKGLCWYESNFNGSAKIYGESSPQYTHYPHYRGVAKRMHSLIPNAKLIYIVRDPVDRVVSHYYQRVGGLKEERSINEVLHGSIDNGYINMGKYFMQVQQYLEYYSREEILIVTLESLIADQRNTLKSIFDFLGVNSNFYNKELYSRTLNEGSKKKKLSSISRILYPKLLRQYLPYKLKLFAQRFGDNIEKPVINEENLSKIVNILKDDVAQFIQLTENNYKEWRNIKLFV